MANTVPGQNGISRLQARILDVLAAQTQPVPASVILSSMIDQPTAAQRVSLSKSLRRLEIRGLVVAFAPEVARPGRGYLYRLCT